MLVKVYDGDLLDALRRLKLKLGKDGLLAQIRSRRYYLKPSDARKFKRFRAARKRNKWLKLR